MRNIARGYAACASARSTCLHHKLCHTLGGTFGVPPALRDIGMSEDGIDRAADLALASPYWNSHPLEPEAIAACSPVPGQASRQAPEGDSQAAGGCDERK